MQPFIAKSNAAAEAQTKLTTIMRQRMGASEADVSSMNKMIAVQTQLGIIGGTVQRSGGGFMVDARAHGQRGAQYTTSSGKIKPVLMWATEGTAVRGRKGWGGKDRGHTRRKGAYRGRMPKYDIIDRAEAQSVTFVEKDLESEIEAAAWRRAKKMGL